MFDSLPIGLYISSKKPILPAHVLVIIRTGLLLAFSVVCSGSVFRFFRKISSPEMFFFMAFIASLSLEVFRAIQPFFTADYLPPSFGTVLTRIVYFSKYLGIFSFFVAGLYAVGFTYEKLGRILFFVSLAALAVVVGMPVDSSAINSNFLHTPGYGGAQIALAVSFEILTLVNFFLAGFLKKSVSYSRMGLAVLLIFLGREMSFFILDPILLGIGFFLLGYGGVLFIKTTRAYYLWT